MLLSPRDRTKLLLAATAQMATSLLDLVGVLLLGLVGTLAVAIVQGQSPPPIAQNATQALGLDSLSSVQVLAILSLSAAGLLLTKSILSSFFLRWTFRFLASRQASLSAHLTRRLLGQSLSFVQRRSSQEVAFALIQGAAYASLVILGQAVVIASEVVLLVLLGVVLLLVSPLIAIASIVFFALVALILQLSLGRWALKAGSQLASADIRSLDAVQEVVGAYREVVVSDRRDEYVRRIESIRLESAESASDLQFISAFPKYMFEVALVLGGFALAGFLFATEDVTGAVGTLSLFLASASRVMPSLLRLQAATISMRNAAGVAEPTFQLAEELDAGPPDDRGPDRAVSGGVSGTRARAEFSPTVVASQISFTYPGSDHPAVQDVSFEVAAGSRTAIVGLSGAGKSTLADLLLGVLTPDTGQLLVSGTAPHETIQQWPGALAYVPQEAMLANSTIRANVALGVRQGDIDDARVWDALGRAHLEILIRQDPMGLDLLVGERGLRLSGGQRQRLGLARALYGSPGLLVLDEATSALDAETELAITETLDNLGSSVTVLVIAHRLSTVRHADQVIYLDRGRCLATGTFEEVRREVPAFERQVGIMGIQ